MEQRAASLNQRLLQSLEASLSLTSRFQAIVTQVVNLVQEAISKKRKQFLEKKQKRQKVLMDLSSRISSQCALDEMEAGVDRAIAIKPVVSINSGKLTEALEENIRIKFALTKKKKAKKSGVVDSVIVKQVEEMFWETAKGAHSLYIQALEALKVNQAESHEKAQNLLTLSAELGNAEAAFRLGKIYEEAKFKIPRNLDKAKHWYKQASEVGHPEAEYSLGGILFQEKEPNLGEIRELFKKAAKGGYAPAMNGLGIVLKKEKKSEEDLKEAVEWFTQAGEAKYATALTNLGICYERGEGVQKDKAKAKECFEQALVLGDHYAGDKLKKYNK